MRFGVKYQLIPPPPPHSPDQGPCCTQGCMFVQQAATLNCSAANECALEQFCKYPYHNYFTQTPPPLPPLPPPLPPSLFPLTPLCTGSSVQCPVPEPQPRNDTISCNNGNNVCVGPVSQPDMCMLDRMCSYMYRYIRTFTYMHSRLKSMDMSLFAACVTYIVHATCNFMLLNIVAVM